MRGVERAEVSRKQAYVAHGERRKCVTMKECRVSDTTGMPRNPNDIVCHNPIGGFAREQGFVLLVYEYRTETARQDSFLDENS